MRRRFGAVKSERAAQAGSEEGPLGSDPGRSVPKRLGPKHVTFSKGSSPAGDAPAVLARVGHSTTPRAVVTSRQRGSRGSRPARGCVQYGNGARCARTVPAFPETPREHFLAERRTQAARVAQSGGGPGAQGRGRRSRAAGPVLQWKERSRAADPRAGTPEVWVGAVTEVIPGTWRTYLEKWRCRLAGVGRSHPHGPSASALPRCARCVDPWSRHEVVGRSPARDASPCS